MDRRTFLSWVGVGWLASSLPVVIAACTSEAATVAQLTVSDATIAVTGADATDGFQTVGTLADLEQTGFLLKKRFSAGPLLVIRNPMHPKTLVAVNATCTHKGCLVDWQAKTGVFECPCHHSKFAPNGSVIKGPATRSLTTYAVRVEGNTILVKG